jgi:hypothetical protein
MTEQEALIRNLRQQLADARFELEEVRELYKKACRAGFAPEEPAPPPRMFGFSRQQTTILLTLLRRGKPVPTASLAMAAYNGDPRPPTERAETGGLRFHGSLQVQISKMRRRIEERSLPFGIETTDYGYLLVDPSGSVERELERYDEKQ